MHIDKPIKQKRSLGALRKANKTKPKSPDLTGQMKLQRHTAAAIVEQFSHDDVDEVVCNIAGWRNQDYNGVYISPLNFHPVSLPEPQLKETTSSVPLSTTRRTTLKISDPATAFRIPKTILATVDAICAKQDLTRSQIFRRSVVEYLRRQNVRMTTDVNPPEPQRTWPMDLFEYQR